MQFKKVSLGKIEKCYAVAFMQNEDKEQLIFAGEGNGSCTIYDASDFSKQQQLWQGGGGTMSIVPIEGEKGSFLAEKGFYSMVECTDANVVKVYNTPSGAREKRLVTLPYLHRFDVLNSPLGNFFIGATIASKKENKEDWSSPGAIYAALLDEKLSSFSVQPIMAGLTQNHGYCKAIIGGCQTGLFGAKEGLFALTPPQCAGDNWKTLKLLDFAVSDVAAIDIDGDGELELAIITPFHGDSFAIYKLFEGEYKCVYQYSEKMDFYHVVTSGKLLGKNVFIGGARRGKSQLFAIEYDNNTHKYVEHVVDSGVGPSNAIIANFKGKDVILSANREIGEAAVYLVTK